MPIAMTADIARGVMCALDMHDDARIECEQRREYVRAHEPIHNRARYAILVSDKRLRIISGVCVLAAMTLVRPAHT
ncbi:hypothetical protein CBA19CS22_25645 [Caballeronia novacaledonica]|uniref:Uncharacterized protein n=1 Tax=Caballeronia novacaledonica TaxID=1544861 RepID=A0ACB5QYA6_9BURK|nr:hypothetical protein CBA19CS22_25645 [Caballeronia novacaledonica]